MKGILIFLQGYNKVYQLQYNSNILIIITILYSYIVARFMQCIILFNYEDKHMIDLCLHT